MSMHKDNDIEFLEINFNQKIYVKLTDMGFEYWYDYVSSAPIKLKKITLENLKDEADSDGYVFFSIWDFMMIFGRTIRPYETPIFYSQLRFIKDDFTLINAGQGR